MNIRQVVQLNSEAAAHLRGGSFTLAIATLSDALHMSREILKKSPARSSNDQQSQRSLLVDDCMETGNHATHSIVDIDDFNDYDHHHHHKMMTSENPSSGFLYRHPIEVQPDHVLLLGSSCNNNDDDKSCMALCAAVIFNLALAHQLAAAAATATMTITASLEKAERLYHLGYTLYSEELSLVHDCCFCPHFLLATINNLGMIYQSLNRPEQAKSTFHVLLSTLIVLGDRLGGGRNISNYEGYFHNTTSSLFLLKNRSAGAA
jgi:hypothetical protein